MRVWLTAILFNAKVICGFYLIMWVRSLVLVVYLRIGVVNLGSDYSYYSYPVKHGSNA